MLRIAEGDEVAFTELFNTWYPLLSTLVLRLTRSELLAEEVVQDVFLKIWMGRESLLYVQHFKPFLWVMAKHLAFDALRKVAAREAREKHYQQNLVTVSAGPEGDVDPSASYHTLIDEAISRLPPQQQRVYLLSRRDRIKQAEIADRMGISVATVKSYLQLAIESITRYVKQKADLGVSIILFLTFFS